MNSLQRMLGLAVVALLAILTPLSAQDSDGDTAPECGGCNFLLNPPGTGNNGAPNPCGTDLRLTIMGFSGSCDQDEESACEQASPCFAGVHVEYRSACPVDFDFELGPLGSIKGSFPFPASENGGWQSVIPPWLETLACGAPMYIVRITIKDTAGYSKFASAQYWCTACE